MSYNRDRLVIFDADGTLIDAFSAVESTFHCHGMDIGDLDRFQKRRKLLKYVGGLKEFPKNIRRQMNRQSRQMLRHTLTDIYRAEAKMFDGMPELLRQLTETPGIRVGVVSRNVTIEPEQSIQAVLKRHAVDVASLDFLRCIPVQGNKADAFVDLRRHYNINPARTFACGDEGHDYLSCLAAGITPLIVSYGFENRERLIEKYGVPEDLVSGTPEAVCARVRNALDL